VFRHITPVTGMVYASIKEERTMKSFLKTLSKKHGRNYENDSNHNADIQLTHLGTRAA
jgi:hypothetical protein